MAKAKTKRKGGRKGEKPAPSPHGRNGRGKDGKFLPGNPGGKGNPLAGRVEQLRAELLAAVTPEDFRKVVSKLIAGACSGDLAYIRELLDRTIGKATTPVELTGKDGGPLQTEQVMPDLSKLTDEQLANLRAIRETLEGSKE